MTESLLEVLIFGVLPAIPGIGLSLLALARIERGLIWQVLGVLMCVGGIILEELMGFAYFDTEPGHACLEYGNGSAIYCEAGVTFSVLALVLFGFGVLDLLAIPVGLVVASRVRRAWARQ
jgi:hypothetical protein